MSNLSYSFLFSRSSDPVLSKEAFNVFTGQSRISNTAEIPVSRYEREKLLVRVIITGREKLEFPTKYSQESLLTSAAFYPTLLKNCETRLAGLQLTRQAIVLRGEQ